jgi:hypothetical protein
MPLVWPMRSKKIVFETSFPWFTPGKPPLGQIGLIMIAHTSPNVKYQGLVPSVGSLVLNQQGLKIKIISVPIILTGGRESQSRVSGSGPEIPQAGTRGGGARAHRPWLTVPAAVWLLANHRGRWWRAMLAQTEDAPDLISMPLSSPFTFGRLHLLGPGHPNSALIAD